jgi:hypothetical protein
MKLYRRIQNVLETTNAPTREPAYLVGIAIVAIVLVLTGVVGNGIRFNIATAQDRDQGTTEKRNAKEAFASESQEVDPPLTERERMLSEKIESLQQELNKLRGNLRATNPSWPQQRFELYDQNRDSKITPREWFERHLSEVPGATAQFSDLEILRRQRDELSKKLGESHRQVQNTLVQIAVLEDELKPRLHSFVIQWVQADSNGDNIVNLSEFQYWSTMLNRQRLTNSTENLLKNRVSQLLRRERLEPLIEQRKMHITTYGESSLLVSNLTLQIQSLEEKILNLEEKEAQIYQEALRWMDGSSLEGLRGSKETRESPKSKPFDEGKHADRFSQQLRRERLEPLKEQRRILLDKFGEIHPQVLDLTVQFESLEATILAMEKIEAQAYQERVRHLKEKASTPGLTDGEGPKNGPRDGDIQRSGPSDREGTRTGPRDGEASRVIIPGRAIPK